MNAPSHSSRRLQIEALETRTLLAADGLDPFGLQTDFYTAMLAVSGTGEFQGSFSFNFGNQRLTLAGNESATLTIDLGALPDFVTNLNISDFANVSIIGTDHLKVLQISDVGTFRAEGLRVTESVTATNVGMLALNSTGSLLVLKGTQTELDVPSLSGTTIVSDLKSLTLESASAEVSLISLNDRQNVYLKGHLPELLTMTGLPQSSVHVILPGTDNPNQPGGETPGPDKPGTDTPTDNGHTIDPSKLIIVSFPLDERTRTFLLELRAALNNASGNTDRLVADFISGQKRISDTGLLALNDAGRNASLNLLASDQIAALAGFSDLSAPTAAAPFTSLERTSVEIGADGQYFVGDPGAVFATSDIAAVSAGMPMAVDVSWITKVLPATTSADSVADSRQSADSSEELTLAESVRAFGSYLIERVTAEFSPGQQSIVLLVDPQPSRAGTGRKADADDEPSAALPVGLLQQV